MKFAHLADAHIGFHQYGLRERAQDFADTFIWTCHKIVEEKCDFVLFAGDLFHHRVVDAVTLSVACEGLKLLPPVYFKKGNHEMQRSRERDFIDFLRSEGLIYPDELDRDFYEVKGQHESLLNIYGFDWAGFSTNRLLSQVHIKEKEESQDLNVLMLHGGVEDILPRNHPGTISWEILRRLVPLVDYIALGHVHKPYQSGNIFNPGSLETVASNEYQWQDRGFFINEWDGVNLTSKKVIPPRRKFIFFDGDWDELEAEGDGAVIVVESTGHAIVEEINRKCRPLYVKLNLVKIIAGETKMVRPQLLNKQQMELEAVAGLTKLSPEFVLQMKGLKDGQEIWSKLNA